jgi:hypothetical protein
VAEHVISIPNSAAIRQARGFLRRTDWRIRPNETAVVLFHPSWCHMQPWVLAALGAWAIAARLEKMTIEIENAHTAGYAWRFGLDELLGADVPETVTQHEETGRFIPLKVITGTHDLKPLIADIAPLLHLAGQPDQAKAIQYVMSEMVRNVLEHSRAPAGAVVAAQY